MGFFDPLRDRASRRAFWLAIPIALELWWIGVFIHGLARDPSEILAGLPYVVFGGAIYGTFLIVSMLLLVAVPAYLLLSYLKVLTLRMTLVCGAAMGLAMNLLAGFPDEDGIFWFLPIPVVLFVGVGTAWAWWWVRARGDRPVLLRIEA
jgi:hypothetical protein